MFNDKLKKEMIRVAIQGVAGCFHEEAARKYFAPQDIEVVPCETFAKLFAELAKDSTLLGIVAIENTIAGALLQNHELLRESNHTIVGELKLRIVQNIATLPSQSLEDIEEVNSHPIALMQCRDWLERRPKVKVVEGGDTASSAQRIAEQNLVGHAAICSELAAELYGLKVLERSIETNKRNFTRFLILAQSDNLTEDVAPRSIDKASIVFTLSHESGELSKVLTILSFYGVNLTKIQSMPIIGREWEYQFYVDLTFTSQERYHQALAAIEPLTHNLKSLGEYAEA